VSYKTNGGNEFIGSSRHSQEELPNVVGKDLAEKIVAQKKEMKDYTGLDLKVGGEGMAGFYDDILVKYANKYAKKWGAKVVDKPLESEGTVFSVVDNRDGHAIADYKDAHTAAQEASKYPDASVKDTKLPSGETAHTLDLTPEMKSDILTKGQSLFALAGAGAAGTLAAASGQLPDKKVNTIVAGDTKKKPKVVGISNPATAKPTEAKKKVIFDNETDARAAGYETGDRVKISGVGIVELE
jgi:hypothetical protein